MFTKKYQTAISIIFITAAMLVAGCKQESPDHQERNRLAQEARTAAPAATGRMAEEADIDQSVTGGTADGRRANQPGAPGQQDEGGFFTAVRMKSMLVRPMEKAAERLLEYHVSLEYQCADFQKARQELLAIVSQYGFIRSGRTDISGTSSLNLGIAVQAKDLYRFLLDMDRIGKLSGERINVNDLTEQMVLSQRQARREDIRLQRKTRGLAGISAAARNWQTIEESIARSEDSQDQAEHRKWQVMDRVNWASVSVSLEPLGAVHVPPYKKALYELLDLVLWIPYALIYLTPIILIFMLIRWKWNSISGMFKKKEEDKKE
ncbi:MAG TPA: DUF4349 domain-containing protein [Spirochaetota bacterium]|nr:DUF4349 domain-containing protein [Spirochaetota bacterium]